MTFLAILLIAGLFTACDNKEKLTKDVLSPSKELKVQLPTYNLTTTDGKKITIKVTQKGWVFEQYPNKVILLNFFATWCPPCKAEIPHLNHLQKIYQNDFQVISVLVENDKDNQFVNDFIDEYGIQYPVTNSAENFNLVDGVGGVSSIPAMFIFNKNGIVVQRYVGAVKEEILDSDILKAIKQ